MGARRSSSGGASQPKRRNILKGAGDGAQTTAKIGLVATILAALIAGTATVVVAVINDEPNRTPTDQSPPVDGPPVEITMPQPTCPTCSPGGLTFTQQVHTSNPAGTTAFRDPRNFRGAGPRVKHGQKIEVVCRFHDPNSPASAWWYLVDSWPWNRQYYTPATSYLNGDPPEGPHVTIVDTRVPVC